VNLVSRKTAPSIASPKQVSISVEPVLLDIPSAATFLATSTHQVRYLINTRKLSAATLGKKLVISVASLREYADKLVAA
jgi:hypothetical protein